MPCVCNFIRPTTGCTGIKLYNASGVQNPLDQFHLYACYLIRANEPRIDSSTKLFSKLIIYAFIAISLFSGFDCMIHSVRHRMDGASILHTYTHARLCTSIVKYWHGYWNANLIIFMAFLSIYYPSNCLSLVLADYRKNLSGCVDRFNGTKRLANRTSWQSNKDSTFALRVVCCTW
jgi:hypothetical protein